MSRRHKARAIVFPMDVTLLAQASVVGEGLMGVNIFEPLAPEGERFPGILETMAPEEFPRELRAGGIQDEWYHGTTGSNAREIIRGGFRPREQGRTQLAPIGGRVYLARSVDEGLKHSVFRSGWSFGKTEEDGGLVRISLKDPTLLWPDEDEIGRIIAEGYMDMIGYRGGLNTKEDTAIFNRLWPNLSLDFKEKMERIPRFRLNELAYQAMLGKRALKWIPDYRKDLLSDIIDHFDKVSTPYDNVVVEEVWIFKRGDFPEIKNHWSPELRTMIKRSEHIKAHGIGSGWHREPTRHSLAARGIRTR